MCPLWERVHPRRAAERPQLYSASALVDMVILELAVEKIALNHPNHRPSRCIRQPTHPSVTPRNAMNPRNASHNP
ncbi:hypothetical protein PS623_04511 [Pseudomonas fluorescens]|nr:hypothetical protein PS623_04511 [Pseudomonas fluorescens]